MKKIIVMLFVAFALTACVSTDSSVNTASKGSSKTNKLSFKSEEGSLFITNGASCDVVVFAGRVERQMVLGGIKSGEGRSFNLSKLPNIPKKGAMLIRIVPYSRYKETMRITEIDVVFTSLVVYDIDNTKDKTELEIPEKIDTDQKYGFYSSNTSNFVVEVRLNSPTGEVIATLPPMSFNKRVFLLPDRTGMIYRLFPRFIYVDPNTNEKIIINSSMEDLMAMNPKPLNGGPQMIDFRTPSNDNVPNKGAMMVLVLED